MKHIFSTTFCAIVYAAALLALLPAQAQTTNDTLNKYVSDLQKNPLDAALREKIIKLVLTMDPKPALPGEVAIHEGAAEYAFKSAKTNADFADAAQEYEKALLAAPWLAADYFNCGVAYEKAENFDAAIRNFNLYLTAAPDAQDATDVRKRIGGLKYAAEKEAKATEAKAKESSPEAVAAEKQNDFKDLLKKIDGRTYILENELGVFTQHISEGYLVGRDGSRTKLQGRETIKKLHTPHLSEVWSVQETWDISEDGDRIDCYVLYSDGNVGHTTFVWQP